MKEINLTISERLAALNLFNSFKGSLSQLSTIIDDIKETVITEAEWLTANRQIISTEQGDSWQWENDKPDTFKNITLQQQSVDYLLKAIKDKSDSNDIAVSDAALLSLNTKLSKTVV